MNRQWSTSPLPSGSHGRLLPTEPEVRIMPQRGELLDPQLHL